MALFLSVLVVLLSHATLSSGLWGSLKIDCGVSVWSAWGPTTNGVRTRTRQIFRYPSNGGAPCPPLTETDIDPWAPQNVAVKASLIRNRFISGISQSSSSRKRRQTTIRSRDILFIVDMSGSISLSEYLVAKNNLAALIGKICGGIGLGIQNNRAAVITYSDDPVENFDFDFYTTVLDVQNAVQNLPRTSGNTCTGKALNYAQTMFDHSSGARPDSQSVKEVVLLTDGMDSCPPPPDPIDMVEAAFNLKNSRYPLITMFVFAIGNNFDTSQFDAIASDPLSSHLFNFVDHDEFEEAVYKIVNFDVTCAPIEIG